MAASDRDLITLDLADVYHQLRREVVGRKAPLPLITLPSTSTLAESSQLMADILKNNQTEVWLSSKEDRERRRERIRALALSTDLGTLPNSWPTSLKGSASLRENARPIQIEADTPAPEVPDRPSPETRERLKKLAMESQDDPYLALDPYPVTLVADPFQRYLPTVLGSGRFEIIDASESDDSKICILEAEQMLWDTGAHRTVITEDLLPAEFVRHARTDEYMAIYGTGDRDSVVQISMEVQFSNCVKKIEGVAIIRSSSSMPNNFSGIILGQHTILGCLEYHAIPAKIMRARGKNIEDKWGHIRLLGCIVGGEYCPL